MLGVGGGGRSSMEPGKQWGRSGRILSRCLAPWSGWSSRALQRASCLLNGAQGQRGQRGGLEHGQRRVSLPRPGCVRPLAATAQPGRASQDGTGVSAGRLRGGPCIFWSPVTVPKHTPNGPSQTVSKVLGPKKTLANRWTETEDRAGAGGTGS